MADRPQRIVGSSAEPPVDSVEWHEKHADGLRYSELGTPPTIHVGQEILVHGRVFFLAEFMEKHGDPARVVFKTYEELHQVFPAGEYVKGER